jgi:RNA polymerase sigma-70 factor (ECF subfamily)
MGPESAAIEAIYRSDWGRIVAVLIRLVGDFDIAEEAAQQAFEAAIEQWRDGGVPEHARAWIIQTARNKAIDRIRRQRNLEKKVDALSLEAPARFELEDPDAIPDERLRLIFTCCHPAIALEAQVALTLRTLGGLDTEEIARAFLVPPVTMAQRLVRAKKKILEARIPYVVPSTRDMPERLDAVLDVIYLVFNEGYAATRGASLVRADLSTEAIQLARMVRRLLPEPYGEASGLLALLLLHDARREARLDASGDVLLLEDQDRSLWNRAQIAEALPLVEEAFANGPGAFAVQAAIAAVHCTARRKEDTDWPRIVGLYDLLFTAQPTPIVALNRAAAVAMAEGPKPALDLVNAITGLDDYHLFHAARADLLRRLGSRAEAAASYRRALELVGNDSERRFLERRLREVSNG